MTTLNISLPKPLRSFVEDQASQGGYSSTSEYVRALIREARTKQEQAELEQKLLEGLATAPAAMAKADWARLRRSVRGARR